MNNPLDSGAPMPPHIELTLEQQFTLKTFRDSAAKLSRDQLQVLLIEVIRQGMAKENLYKRMLKG